MRIGRSVLYGLTRWVRLARLPRGRRRWSSVADAVPVWDERNQRIAEHIEEGASVLDLGCGAQTLAIHLRSPARYLPGDLIPSASNVVPIDLNRNMWPKAGREFDVAVMSGVLEYLDDPARALERVHDFAPKLVTSYQDYRNGERTKRTRRALGWVNHLTRAEIVGAFLRTGWEIETEVPWRDSQIYVLRESAPRSANRGSGSA